MPDGTKIPNGQYCLRDSDCMSGVKRDCHHAKVSDSGSDGNGSFICVFAGVLCGKLEQNIEKMEV